MKLAYGFGGVAYNVVAWRRSVSMRRRSWRNIIGGRSIESGVMAYDA